MPGPGTRMPCRDRRETLDLPRSMQAALCPLDCCGFWLASNCLHLETTSALREDGPALTNATVVAPARPPSSMRIFEPLPSRAAHFENTYFETTFFENTWHGVSRPGRCNARRIAAWKCVAPDRTALVAPVIARTGFVRRQSTAADPGIPRTDDRRAAHAFQRARLGSDNRGQIDITDIDGSAEDVVRTPGYLTG